MKFLPATFFLLSTSAKAADTNTLPALAPAYGELPPMFWEQHGMLVIIGLFTFLVLASLVLWKIYQPKPAIILPPEVLARNALTKLLRQPEDGKVLSEASQILRRYILAAFDFAANELTTAEFCDALANHKQIGTEVASSISDFLRECDERKFSTASSSAPLDAANRALEIIALSKKTRDRRDACPTEK